MQHKAEIFHIFTNNLKLMFPEEKNLGPIKLYIIKLL